MLHVLVLVPIATQTLEQRQSLDPRCTRPADPVTCHLRCHPLLSQSKNRMLALKSNLMKPQVALEPWNHGAWGTKNQLIAIGHQPLSLDIRPVADVTARAHGNKKIATSRRTFHQHKFMKKNKFSTLWVRCFSTTFPSAKRPTFTRVSLGPKRNLQNFCIHPFTNRKYTNQFEVQSHGPPMAFKATQHNHVRWFTVDRWHWSENKNL